MQTFTIKSQDTILHGIIKGNLQASHVLITLHGGPGGNKEDMSHVNVCKQLEQDYLCVYFDQRGCGQSTYDLQMGVTLSMLVEDVKAVVDYIKQCYPTLSTTLLAMSFGGYLGLASIATYPTLVDTFIGCNPAITFSRQEALAMYQRSQKRYLERFPTWQATSTTPEEAMQSDAFKNFVFSNQNTAHSLRYIQAMSSWFFTIDFSPIIKNIKIPTLLFQGKKDIICHEGNLQKAITKTKNSHIQYYPLENCQHDIDDFSAQDIVKISKQFIKGAEKTC